MIGPEKLPRITRKQVTEASRMRKFKQDQIAISMEQNLMFVHEHMPAYFKRIEEEVKKRLKKKK